MKDFQEGLSTALSLDPGKLWDVDVFSSCPGKLYDTLSCRTDWTLRRGPSGLVAAPSTLQGSTHPSASW